MGFVFLMGGWRRFVIMTDKHDIDSASHLANKLVSAAPGSPIEGVVHWVLYNPLVAEWSVYLMSTAEVIVGLSLIVGFMTRLGAFGAALLNIALMLIFGWMGYECLDEWTMAALGFAISIAVLIFGPGSFSLDNRFSIDVLSHFITRKSAAVMTIVSILFTVGFYSYLFGIFSFEKRTSTSDYTILAEATDQENIATLYVNGGGSSKAAYVQHIVFDLPDGSKVELTPGEIEVVRNHFSPWSQSGKVVDNVLKLRLGSKTDIRISDNAESARISLIDNADPVVVFEKT